MPRISMYPGGMRMNTAIQRGGFELPCRGLWTVIIVASSLAAQSKTFEVRSDFDAEGAWVTEYLTKVHAQLVKLMDNAAVEPPTGIAIALRRDVALRGVAGAATARTLTFTSDQWPKDQWRMWIVAHEMANLFAHHYAGAGGYPSDWWANGRSPFPVYAAAIVAERLGENETARWLKTVDAEKPDQKLFWKLHERGGFKTFSRFFKLLREDGVDLARIGQPWPAADERRSTWAAAYLSMAAGTNLAALLREHGVGSEPADWKARHPNLPFQPYVLTDSAVGDVMEVRAHLFGSKSAGRALEVLRAAFRRGDTWAPTEARVRPQEASPMAFAVESDFGAESAWMQGFVSKAAAAVVALYGDAAMKLPARVPVRLRKDPSLKGAAGGATSGAIDLTGDQWPEDSFRLMISANEVVNLCLPYAAGGMSPDCFGHGDKTFTNYAAAVLLRQLGLNDVAAGMRDPAKRDLDLLWTLHDAHGADLYRRAFALLRRDAVDFTKIGAGQPVPQRAKTMALIKALSLAAGKNLAPVFRDHGIGANRDGAPKGYVPYAIDDAEIDAALRSAK